MHVIKFDQKSLTTSQLKDKAAVAVVSLCNSITEAGLWGAWYWGLLESAKRTAGSAALSGQRLRQSELLWTELILSSLWDFLLFGNKAVTREFVPFPLNFFFFSLFQFISPPKLGFNPRPPQQSPCFLSHFILPAKYSLDSPLSPTPTTPTTTPKTP